MGSTSRNTSSPKPGAKPGARRDTARGDAALWDTSLWDAAAALCVGLAAFLIYLRTMAPTIYGLDSAELSTGAYTLGIVHAPGSPLYLLLGWLFTRLPLGDVGYRMNLFSAIAGAVCAVFFYLSLRRLAGLRSMAGGSPLLAALCALWVAVTYYIWISAVAAELYAPASAFFLIVVFLALRWYQDQRLWQLALLGWLFGLSLGIHLMAVLAAPGLAVLVLGRLRKDRPARDWKSVLMTMSAAIAVAVGAALLGALVYLYLPIRYLADPALNYARDYWRVNLATWDGFWWMVSGRMFSGFMFSVPLAGLPAEIGRFAYQLWSNFSGLGVFLGLWGLVALFKRERVLWSGLALMFGLHLAFYLPYSVADKETMMQPAHLIWGLWMGVGVYELAAWLRGQAPQVAAPLAAGSLLVILLATLWLNFPLLDISRDFSARQKGQAMLPLLARDAWFIGSWEDVPILEYLQIVEGQRPDIHLRNVIFTGMEEARLTAGQMLAEGYPVYTSIPDWFIGNPGITVLQTGTGVYKIQLK